MSRINLKEFKGILSLAGKLRNNQTPSEKLLWEILRRKSLFGYKFLRQHTIFYRVDKNWVYFYVPDFYCSRLKLIIELDGPVHLGKIEYDTDRDEKLTSKGIKVLRFKNEELNDINNVIGIIKKTIFKLEKQIIDGS